ESDGGNRYPQVPEARDIDQRRFGDDRGRSHDFGEQQEGERAGAADEGRADEAHDRLTRDAERETDAGLRRGDPEADLADLLGDRAVVLLLELTGEHRSEDRLEAGLELLRQAGDLLGDVIDADGRGHGEQAEDEDVEAPGAPFDRVGGGKR